jgi:anti-sigma regulatory factor (Ser/Thr protein kinase)
VEAVLIDTWLQGEAGIAVHDEASVSLARDEVRRVGARLALSAEITEAMTTVASELAHNHLAHARSGVVVVRSIERDGAPGIEVVAADRGEGIRDPERALRGTGESSSGLGIGLSGVRGLADEIDVDIRLGEGTCVWARKHATRARRRREIGIFGRAHPSERVSGDHAAFVRLPDALVVAACDGLGHGPPARDASSTAIARFVEHPERDASDVFVTCHEALKQKRGAVMAITRIAEPDGACASASVGNVSVYVAGTDAKRFGGASFVLGSPGALRPPHVDRTVLAPRSALLLYSDGITSRAQLDGRADLLREHPIVIAQTVVREFARDDDDVLVLVAR